MEHLRLFTYLIHAAESFLRNQLVLQLVKKFPAFYGTRKFITALTSARHLRLLLDGFYVKFDILVFFEKKNCQEYSNVISLTIVTGTLLGGGLG